MKKTGSLLLSLTLLGTVLAACGGNSDNNGNSQASPSGSPSSSGSASPSAGGDAAKPDTSKKVELVWYLLGDASSESAKVNAEFNKLLEKDLNTTVKFNFTTWNDWQTKYNLLLASGEKIDMLFASTWADYYKFANQGAFLPLDDLLPKYAPETWNKVPQQDWTEATVKGKIYAVPATYPEYTPDGLVYREDWRQELNLPEIKDLDTLEAYLDGVKKAKPDVTPINGKAWNEAYTLFKSYSGYEQIGGDSGVVVAKSYDAPRDIVAYPFTDEFEAWVKRMKTWADKGFWTSDSLASQKEAGDAIKVGTGAVYWRNAPGAGGYITDMEKNKPDIKMGYFPFTRFHNYAMPTLSVNNAMAIPKSAPNPERTLMVLDKLRNDPKYYDLLTYGIEGTHYSIADDGKSIVKPPKGMEGKKDFKGYDIASWGWRIESMSREKQAAGWTGFDALLAEFKAESKPNIFSPVLLDYAPVKSQQAAVNQVFEQYGKPLMMGLVKDPDKSLATFRDQLKKAGVDKIVDYIKTEASKYYDEKGIQ
ncbi:extracellular solute-binding protein [Cohnella nanjingensis]|uniref:Extracellular solute-binding protein n=2 Tax=Cohnella nanjingensis TaxID=1387779 RepID=A0A7X0VGX7_9BACL|nr:extracellular solute-binding protein [Cohnella nanjingensis]MBB6673552.1 extracellular solute-binding protein [Cohnella nanjingensis]